MNEDNPAKIDPAIVFNKSDQVTARQIEDEFIIVSITPKNERRSDEVFFLNETGRELWENLNGESNINQLIDGITGQYETDCHEQIRRDVFDLIEDLLSHNIIVRVKKEG